MFFKPKTQIVPVLPAASRDAGRTVVAVDGVPAANRSGMISTVGTATTLSGTRPAVSGMRPAVSGTRPAVSGARPAVSGTRAAVGSPSGMRSAVLPGQTAMMPAVDERVGLDGQTLAIWLLSGLLAINMAITVMVLVRIDTPNPELIDQKVQLDVTKAELAKLKNELKEREMDLARQLNDIQMTADMAHSSAQSMLMEAARKQREENASKPAHE
jgi:hypothetical protein